jgi:hypothetical protein
MNRFDGNEIDWTNQYASIGEFVVEFERLVDKIRFWCSVLFQIRGLKDWELSELVFGQRYFTSDPLITCFISLCNVTLKGKEGTEEINRKIEEFQTKFRNQISKRNELLHATYHIGKHTIEVTDKDVYTEMLAIKNSPNKNGSNKKVVANSIEDIKKHIEVLHILNQDFLKLTAGIAIFIYDNDLTIGE